MEFAKKKKGKNGIILFIDIYVYKLTNNSWEQPKGSLFNSYYTKV